MSTAKNYTPKTYGPIYLSQAEYEVALSRDWKRYYGFLARNLRRISDRDFWGYHREGLDKMGYRLEPVRIAIAGLSWFADKTLNPKRTVERLWELLKPDGEPRNCAH